MFHWNENEVAYDLHSSESENRYGSISKVKWQEYHYYAVANMQIKRLNPTIITFTYSEYFNVSINCFITLNLILVGFFFLILVFHWL